MATVSEVITDLGRKLGRFATGKAPAGEDALVQFAGLAWGFVSAAYEQTESQRGEVQKLRDFYNGEQILGTGLNAGQYYIPEWPDETDDDIETRATRMDALAWNRVRDGIHTHADALYAWGRERAISREIRWPEGTTISEADQKWLDEFFRERFWRLNSYHHFMWDLWKTVGSERSALVMGMWLDAKARRLKRFPAGVSREGMKDRGVVWLSVLDNLQSIALPDATQDRELGAVIRWYTDPDDQDPRRVASPASPGDRWTITELITDTLWLRWKGRELVAHQWGFENRYGDVRTMFAWVRNPADIADSEDALAAQILLLEDIYSGWEIKRNHAFPETLYRGYEPPTREENGRRVLLRGPNVAHVASDPSADIIKVGPPSDLSDVGVGHDQIHQMLDEAMGLSEIERGGGQGLGQLRSAPAIGRMQSKSERRRRRKILAAEKGEHDIFSAVRDIAVYHAFGADEREAFADADLIVTFPEDAFTLDPYTIVQKDAAEIAAGLSTREDQVRRRNPELSEKEVEEKVRQIEADLESAQQSKGGEPTPIDRSKAQSNPEPKSEGK